MFRQSILYLSESPTARKLVTEMPVSRQLARRFVAGNTLDDAITAARFLNGTGLTVSLDYLGELVRSKREAATAANTVIESLGRMVDEEIRGNVSVKPSQLGLGLDDEFAFHNAGRILQEARELGDGEGEIFVRLDMESSDFTEATIQLVERLWNAGYRNVGTAVQSYLRRSLDDIHRLNRLGSRVRLVKGAYREPPSIAYQKKAEVDRMFVQAMKLLLTEGTYPAIATHDEAMIDATRRYAFEHGIPRNSFEFQMLYGVRRDLQLRLWEEGYHVRVYLPYGSSWYPYLMRRLAERPGNVFFVASNIVRESSIGHAALPLAVGAGVLTGVLTALTWRDRNSR